MLAPQLAVRCGVGRVKPHVCHGYPVQTLKSQVDDLVQDLIVFLQSSHHGPLRQILSTETPVIMVPVLAAVAAELPVRPSAVIYNVPALETPGNILNYFCLIMHDLLPFVTNVKSFFR